MRLALHLTVFAAVTLGPSQATAQNHVENIAMARGMLAPVVSQYPGLAIAVAVGEDIVWAEGFGFADIERGELVTPDTPFNVYSVAKMFTGVAAARLAAQGRLDLDQSVTAIVPGLADHYRSVTPRLLAGHLSGVPHYASDRDWENFAALSCTDPTDAVPHFGTRPLTARPGQRRTYTTYGYVLLSAAVGLRSATGRYLDYMRAAIFEPAGMSSTRLDRRNLPRAAKARPYRATDRGWEEIGNLDASCKFGGGGFVSSARDLASFGRSLYTGTLLDSAWTDLVGSSFLTANGDTTYYGFGMDTNTFTVNGHTVHWVRHSGGSPGGRAFIVSLLTEKVAVGLAANTDGPSLRLAATGIAYLFAGVSPP